MTEETKLEITPEEENRIKSKKPVRFEWLDQFRGIVILMFVVQTFAWKFSGDPSAGILPVVPPLFNHGWKFAEFDGMPQMITLIDYGQQIFMFMVGFMQGYAILKRTQKTENKQAIIHIVKRFLIILVLANIHVLASDYNVWEAFVSGTLANIAWGSLASGLCAILIKPKKSWTRLIIGLGIMVVHSILYAFESIRDWSWGDVSVPFRTINLMAIAIIATAYTSWFFKEDGSISEDGIKSNVLKVSVALFIASYCMSFIQWQHHSDSTTSLSLMSVAISALFIYIFYKIDKDGYHVPGLTALGKNMLAIFLLSMIINELVYIPLIEDFVLINGFFDLVLVGIVPIVLMWICAKILEKFNIIIKV